MPAVVMPIEKDDPYLCGGRESNYSAADSYSLISINSIDRGQLTWQMSTQFNLDSLGDRRGDRYTPAEDRFRKARASNPDLRVSIVPTSNNGPRQVCFILGSSKSDNRLQVNEEINSRLQKARKNAKSRGTPTEIPEVKVEFSRVFSRDDLEDDRSSGYVVYANDSDAHVIDQLINNFTHEEVFDYPGTHTYQFISMMTPGGPTEAVRQQQLFYD